MIMIPYIFCLLVHCFTFSAAPKLQMPSREGVQVKKQIDDWKVQFDAALAMLEKEAQSAPLNTKTLNEIYLNVNNALYKISFLDNATWKTLEEKKDAVFKQINPRIHALINEKLNQAKKIIFAVQYRDFFDAIKIQQFNALLNQFSKTIADAFNLAYLPFVSKDPNGIAIIEELIDYLKILAKNIIKQLGQQLVERTQLKKLDELLLNLNTLEKTLVENESFIKERADLEQNAWIPDRIEADRILREYITQLQAMPQSVGLYEIAHAIDLYNDYAIKADRVLTAFPKLLTNPQLIKQKEIFKLNINNIIFMGIQVKIHEINQWLLKLASLDMRSTYKDMQSNDMQPNAFWKHCVRLIEDISIIHYKYSDFLDHATPSIAMKHSITGAYDALGKNVRKILHNFEKLKIIPPQNYAPTPQEDLKIISMYPQLYGRILGQYEKVSGILADMQLVQFNVKNLLKPFKKVQKELCDITDAIEKANELPQAKAKASAAGTKTSSDSSATAAAGTAPRAIPATGTAANPPAPSPAPLTLQKMTDED